MDNDQWWPTTCISVCDVKASSVMKLLVSVSVSWPTRFVVGFRSEFKQSVNSWLLSVSCSLLLQGGHMHVYMCTCVSCMYDTHNSWSMLTGGDFFFTFYLLLHELNVTILQRIIWGFVYEAFVPVYEQI